MSEKAWRQETLISGGHSSEWLELSVASSVEPRWIADRGSGWLATLSGPAAIRSLGQTF